MKINGIMIGFNMVFALLLFLFGRGTVEALQTVSEDVEQLKASNQTQDQQMQSISRGIESNEELLFDVFNLQFYGLVDATVYHAVEEQTDSTPTITADGTNIDPLRASDYKYIAVSRDLHTRWGGKFQFNDVVYIDSDHVHGFFIIKDVMNARFTNRIDFLQHEDEPIFKLSGVELYATNIQITHEVF